MSVTQDQELAAQGRAVRFGYLEPVDTGVLQILQLLAREPAYAAMPFGRALEMIQAIKQKSYLASVSHGACTGVVLFATISSATARQCAVENRMPVANEIDPAGAELCLTAVCGSPIQRLLREFFRLNRGRIILYERHVPGGQGPRTVSRGLTWLDRDGVVGGARL